MLAAYTRLPLTVYVLCVGTFINRAGTLLIPFLTMYATDALGQRVELAAITMGAYGLGAVLGQTIGGHLADRVGRRPVMLGALFGGAALMCTLAFVRTPALFLAGVFTLALVADMLRPAVQAMIADLVPPLQRPHSFALMYVSINLGFAVGPMIGGLLAEHSFRAIFFADAATSCAYGLIILALVPETLPLRGRAPGQPPAPDAPGARPVALPAAAPAPVDAGYFGALRQIISDRAFVAFCCAVFLTSLVFMQSLSTFPLYLRQLGYRPATFGWIIAVNGWLIVLLQVPVTAWLTGYSRPGLLIVGALLAGIGVGLQGLAEAPFQFAVAVAIWTLGEIIQAPLFGPIVADLAPLHMRARYMGVFGMTYSGANMLGAPLGGLLLARLGGGVVWSACVVLALLAAAIYWRIGPRITGPPGPRAAGPAVLDSAAPDPAATRPSAVPRRD